MKHNNVSIILKQPTQQEIEDGTGVFIIFGDVPKNIDYSNAYINVVNLEFLKDNPKIISNPDKWICSKEDKIKFLTMLQNIFTSDVTMPIIKKVFFPQVERIV